MAEGFDFVAMGRAALAGLLSLVYLRLTGATLPTRRQLQGLGLTALGIVFGWPIFLGLAMRQVDAVHSIGGAQAQHMARAHRHQPLAGFQHRQRAKQPLAIQNLIPHRCPLWPVIQTKPLKGHIKVKIAQVTAGTKQGKPAPCSE